MKFHFSKPSKGTSSRRTTSFDALSVKIHAGVSAVGEWKNQKKVVNMRQRSEHFGCIFRLFGEKKPLNGLSPIFSWWEVSMT